MVSSSLIKSWIAAYPAGVFTSDGKIIYCQACSQSVPCTVVSHLKQHTLTKRHKEGMERFDQNNKKQSLLTNYPGGPMDNFSQELCNCLVASNIPFHKLTISPFRSFLSKYTKRAIPDASTLRKNYLDKTYLETMEQIKSEYKGKYVWVTLDETTDSQSRYVANLMVGVLDEQKFHPARLVAVKMLEVTNNSTIARFFNDSLVNIGIPCEKVLLAVTDAAPYMIKAFSSLAAFYPSLIHVTCICHGLHRVAEGIRKQYASVDNLISQTKKVFSKAPYRIALYKEKCPGVALPPQPILIRWATWLEAAVFYADNFDKIKPVIEELDPSEAACIGFAQEMFAVTGIKADLAYIKAHFSIIIVAIRKLEAQGLQMTEAFDVIQEVHKSLLSAPGAVAIRVLDKFKAVIQKNTGLAKLKEVAAALSGSPSNTDLSPQTMALLKFAPLQSVDVERSFSIYNTILTDSRSSFTPSNLEKYVVSSCYMRV